MKKQSISWVTEPVHFNTDLEEGRIIIELTDNGLSYYGDLFQFIGLDPDYTDLEWYEIPFHIEEFLLGDYDTFGDVILNTEFILGKLFDSGLQMKKEDIIKEIEEFLLKDFEERDVNVVDLMYEYISNFYKNFKIIHDEEKYDVLDINNNVIFSGKGNNLIIDGKETKDIYKAEKLLNNSYN